MFLLIVFDVLMCLAARLQNGVDGGVDVLLFVMKMAEALRGNVSQWHCRLVPRWLESGRTLKNGLQPVLPLSAISWRKEGTSLATHIALSFAGQISRQKLTVSVSKPSKIGKKEEKSTLLSVLLAD